MNKYIKTTFIFFGVWFTASLMNGFLSGIAMAFLNSHSFYNGTGNFSLSIFFSFVFSAPLVGFVWLVAIIAQLNGARGEALFQFILGTAFFCALAGAVGFAITIGTSFKEAKFAIGLCICVSALSSVLIFRKQLKINE